GDARQSRCHSFISCCVKLSHGHCGVKVFKKQSLCHFGTQTNKRLKRDCQRVAFPVPLSRGGYGCCV
ncbi:hypothetical protein DDN98_19255, partial [Vibrio cholerae]|nr:hypothetical protein [Vibrio cholerae]